MDLAEIDYSLSLYPWPRTYKIAQSEQNVLIYPLFKNPQRVNQFHFICPFTAKIPLYLFKLSSRKDIHLTTLEQAKAFTIGLVRNNHDHLMLKKQGFEDGKNLDANVSDSYSLKKLLKGRIDLMILSSRAMARLLRDNQVPKQSIETALTIPQDLTGENCIAMSLQSDPILLKKISKALKVINKKYGLLHIDQ